MLLLKYIYLILFLFFFFFFFGIAFTSTETSPSLFWYFESKDAKSRVCFKSIVPWLHYSFSDISLSVCLFTCVYMMLVALSMCLRVGVGIVWGILCSSDRSTFSSSVGMSIEWLTCVTGHRFAPRRVQL